MPKLFFIARQGVASTTKPSKANHVDDFGEDCYRRDMDSIVNVYTHPQILVRRNLWIATWHFCLIIIAISDNFVSRGY
jgi:hypothetical protein